MSDPAQPATERSYGCTFGCGNPYDYVFISVRDGTTEFLCLPCFVKLAADMVTAVVESDDDSTALWNSATSGIESAPMTRGGAKRRGHNAPATTDDPDLFAAYDAVITVEELPDEFT